MPATTNTNVHDFITVSCGPTRAIIPPHCAVLTSAIAAAMCLRAGYRSSLLNDSSAACTS
jgi:hypothetical protein